MSNEIVYTDKHRSDSMNQFIHGGANNAKIGLQNTLGKRSSLDEALDITAKAIDELSNRLNVLTEKLSPICLPMISDSPRDEERQPSSPVVNRMFAHLKLIDKINRDVNLLLNSLDI